MREDGSEKKKSGADCWNSVCVFAGSQVGSDPLFALQARRLGTLLVDNGWGLVYGGGSVGLMGEIADAVLNAGGNVVGVIPDFLATKELLHSGLTETIVTRDMHTRKAKMAELSDAFVALPGGLGTFEEVFEIITWAQLGVHSKPIGLLNVAGFYEPVLKLLDHSIELGFVSRKHRLLLEAAQTAEELLDQLRKKQMPELPHWSDWKST